MSGPKGFAPFKKPEDLLQKLEHDYERMQLDPYDSYAAFDFFVTAEHMLDWLHPDSEGGGSKRKELRETNEILQIVSHIASGAKHFEATAKHHKSVDKLEASPGAFDPRAFSTEAFDPGAFNFAGITVTLTNGKKRHVYDLANQVIKYWKKNIRDT